MTIGKWRFAFLPESEYHRVTESLVSKDYTDLIVLHNVYELSDMGPQCCTSDWLVAQFIKFAKENDLINGEETKA